MEESDIYYVDTRNADNRRATVISTGQGGIQGPLRTVVAQPGRVFAQGQAYPQGQPLVYAMPPQPMGSSLFGKVTAGQLVDLVAQIFAALMPLPAAPTATADAATDAGNLILYQTALAQYAKRDEQVRTLGNIVTRLLG
jgi:hypothetical protein